MAKTVNAAITTSTTAWNDRKMASSPISLPSQATLRGITEVQRVEFVMNSGQVIKNDIVAQTVK
jgi:hypothetical protein